MDESYVRLYPELERTHFWWRIRQRMVRSVISETGRPERRVLDIGCGSGATLEAVVDICDEVTGVEIDPLAVPESAVLRDRIRVGDLAEQAFDAGEFDAVLLMDVIEHVEDSVDLLTESSRVLAPGGLMFVTVPAFNFLWSEHDVINHHFRRYTKRALAAELAAAGLVIDRNSYFFASLVIPKLVTKYLPVSEAEVGSTSGILHRTMTRLISVEYRLWERAPSVLAFGTSVIAVARKP